MSPPSANPGSTSSRWNRLDGIWVFLVFFVAGGDPTPHRNEAHYLARLKHYWDPDWCSGDFFLETPDAHFTVVWLFGWVTLFASLETTAWIGRMLTWGLLAWGWTRVSHRVTTWPAAATMSAALFVVLTEQTHFAGEWVVGGFEAKSVAYGFVLLALSDFLDGRWNRAWTLLGVASAFHALVGGWSVVALLITWALGGRYGRSLVSMAPGLCAGGVISLFGVAPALMLNAGVDRETVAAAHQIYVFDRLPHHLALLSEPLSWLVWRVLRYSIGLGLFVVLSRRRLLVGSPTVGAASAGSLRKLVNFAIGSLSISAVGFLIELALWGRPELAAPILRYYFFRLADVSPAIATSFMLVAAIDAGMAAKKRWAPTLTLLCVAACLWWVGGYAGSRLSVTAPPADVKMHDKAAWREMCEWIAENTETDALFLVPRLSHTFKWFAGRPEVVTYKDVPQNAAALVEWKRRFADVFIVGERLDGSPRWADSLAGLGATRLRELAESYGADYALDQTPPWAVAQPRQRRASLPIVHRVGPYTLYDLRP